MPVGDTEFRVDSARISGPAAVQILSGNHVVGALERVPADRDLTLTLDLSPGAYRMSCTVGLVESGGEVLVGSSAAPPELGQAPDLAAAMVAYRSYLAGQASQFRSATAALLDAIRQGSTSTAQTRYSSVCAVYGHVRAAAANFFDELTPGLVDLDAEIDPAVDPAQAGRQGGLPGVEYGLWVRGSTAGLIPVATGLVASATALQQRIGTLDLDGLEVASGATFLLDDVTSQDLTGIREPYSHLGLVDARSAVEGAQGAFVALRSAISRRDRGLGAELTQSFSTAAASFSAAASGQPAVVAQGVDALADAMSSVESTLSQPVPS